MTRQTDGKSLYEQQEQQILAQSDAFISLLTKRGILGDHKIDNDKIRKAQQEKNRKSYHNTQLLLQHYRNIAWLLECLPMDIAKELEEPYEDVDIVFDLSELKGKLLPVGMMIALDYIWDSVKKDLTKKKAVMIDEIWKLVGTSSNKQAAEFCLTIFKTIRGFGGAAVYATQDLSDFFGLEDGKYGRAIINNSKNKVILNLEPDEAKYVQDVLKLTKTEIQSITRFERGEALIYSNNNKVPVLVKASKVEHEMITTDRAELEAILRERQKEHTHSE